MFKTKGQQVLHDQRSPVTKMRRIQKERCRRVRAVGFFALFVVRFFCLFFFPLVDSIKRLWAFSVTPFHSIQVICFYRVGIQGIFV